MAGMLPGVEAARRRRFHKNNSLHQSPAATSSRRSSFCLYAASHDLLHSADSSHLQRMKKSIMIRQVGNKMSCDESRLGEAARQAKKRLDDRLQPAWAPHKNRFSQDRPINNGDQPWLGDPCKVNRSGVLMRWLRVRWIKWSEVGDESCAVCLEPVNRVGTLVRLGCGHRFHTDCLRPWVQANAHCPCCRTKINPSDSIATICKTVLPFSSVKRRRLPAEQCLSKQQSDNLKWQQDSFHRMLNLMGLSKEGIVSEFQVSSFRTDLLEKLVASPAEHEPPLVLRDKLIFLQELLYARCISEEEYHASKRPLLQRLAVQGAEINARDVIFGPQKEIPKDEWSVIDLKDNESLEASSAKKSSKGNSAFKKIKGGAVSVFGFVSPDKGKRPKESNVTYIGNKSNCSKENHFPHQHYSNKEENDSKPILMDETEKKQNVCEKAERKPFTAKALFFDGLMKWKKTEAEYVTASFSLDESSDGTSYGGKLVENPVAEGPNTKQIKRKLHPNGSPADFFVDKVVGEKIKRELCRYPNVHLSDDEVEVISTRLPIDKTDLQRFFPKTWCDEYGDIVLHVVRKEFKEHMMEMGHSRTKVAEKRKNIHDDRNSNPNPFAPKEDQLYFTKRTSMSSSNNARAPLINTGIDNRKV